MTLAVRVWDHIPDPQIQSPRAADRRDRPVLATTSEVVVTTTIGMTGRTGEKCPVSGVWKWLGTPSTTIPLSKGETFPPYNGKAGTWQLISYA